MVIEIMAGILSLIGIFFFFVGVLGLFRFPDALTRIHAAAKCDTLGAFLIIFALILLQGWSSETIKLGMIIAFIWLTNPTGSHVIARAAYFLRLGSSKDIPVKDYTHYKTSDGEAKEGES